jgi:hypothetical protein
LPVSLLYHAIALQAERDGRGILDIELVTNVLPSGRFELGLLSVVTVARRVKT